MIRLVLLGMVLLYAVYRLTPGGPCAYSITVAVRVPMYGLHKMRYNYIRAL